MHTTLALPLVETFEGRMLFSQTAAEAPYTPGRSSSFAHLSTDRSTSAIISLEKRGDAAGVASASRPAVRRSRNGILEVRGTSGPDQITLGHSSAQGTSGVTFLDVTVNGVTQQFDPLEVRRISVRAGKGDDAIDAFLAVFYGSAGHVKFPVTLDGGPGNDQITASQHRDRLIGGAGNDVFLSQNFSNRARGDLVLGGAGNDRATIDGAQGPGYPGDITRSIETVAV